MNWYTAKLIFRIISGDGCHCAQFDEQLRLIKADNEQNAFEKANMLGCAEQDSFLNIHKETVQWQFIAVTEINCINGLNDGAELYYIINEAPDAKAYIKVARQRAALLFSAVKQR